MSSDHYPPCRHICMPPAPLRGLVRYFHVERADACHVMVPATPYPMITFFISGGSFVGDCGYSKPFVCGPTTTSFYASWLPGTSFVTAVCEPARFGELFGVDMRELRDRPTALDALSPAPHSDALQEALFSSARPIDWVEALGAWLLELARRREERVLRAFALPPALLMAPSSELALRFGLSVRQFERKHALAYGLTLRESRSMARYATALGLVVRNGARRGMLTTIACAAGYHDQAHMIHDFRRFLGVAPGSLVSEPESRDGDALRLLRYDPAEAQIVAGAAR